VISSQYSLLSSFQELSRECKERSMGKQRAEQGSQRAEQKIDTFLAGMLYWANFEKINIT
jgi:hypothetical protein